MRRLPGTIATVALAMLLPIGEVVGQLTVAQPSSRTAGSAIATVESLHHALLTVMRQADGLGFAGRRQRLVPVVRDSFDFTTISAAVLSASQWKKLTDSQRLQMENTFHELTLATYADRFDGYSGEQFRTIAQRRLRQGRVLVQSELAAPDGEAVELDYVLQPVGDKWRIVNILADGVSDLSVKRAEYSSILRTDGFDQLIARLEKQIAELSAD